MRVCILAKSPNLQISIEGVVYNIVLTHTCVIFFFFLVNVIMNVGINLEIKKRIQGLSNLCAYCLLVLPNHVGRLQKIYQQYFIPYLKRTKYHFSTSHVGRLPKNISTILYPTFEKNKLPFFNKWVSTLLHPPLQLFKKYQTINR